MSYTYTTRNGQRVEVAVAAAFDRMAAAFKAATGKDLLVTSGTRTRAEQESIFRQRYVTAGAVAGRKVYDTRSWNGVLWYRISSAGTVAVPGTSNHEDDGPSGPRSLDLHDNGADKGVTTRGTARDNWMAAHAGEFGFANDGYNFGEPWHKTYQGALGAGAPAAGGGASSQDTKNRQQWLNDHRGESLKVDGDQGAKTNAAYDRYQTFLKASWGYTGAIDHQWGAGTQAAHQRYADSLAAPAAPSTPSTTGRASISKGAKGQLVVSLQNRLNSRYPAYSKLRVDGDFGDATDKVVREFQKRAGLKVDGIVGPQTWGALGL